MVRGRDGDGSGLRGKIFNALTGLTADVTGRAGGDLRGQLLAVGGPSTRTRSGIDLTRAAKALGVSRRTAERWAAGTQNPSPRVARALATRARQAATTQAGRRAALAGSTTRQAIVSRGARLSITALQGPHTRDYMRSRTTQLDLDPTDAQGMLDAWEQGGDKGFMSWATNRWGQDYLDDWRFGDVDDITIESPYGGGWR